MSEYYLSYADLLKFVNERINPSDSYVVEYKAELLTALTRHTGGIKSENIAEIVTLWDNQLHSPSELLLGTRYIRLSEVALCFVAVALESGLLEALMGHVSGLEVTLSSGQAVCIVLAIRNLLSSICTLDDWDFCIYLQATTHFKEHKSFTREELVDWFPKDSHICNMHNSKWNCTHNNQNDACCILNGDHIDNALDSLCYKGILEKKMEVDTPIYKFKF